MLATALQTILRKGDWNFSTPKGVDRDYVKLINFMKEEDPELRPSMAEVVDYIDDLLQKHMATLPKSHVPNSRDMFEEN